VCRLVVGWWVFGGFFYGIEWGWVVVSWGILRVFCLINGIVWMGVCFWQSKGKKK